MIMEVVYFGQLVGTLEKIEGSFYARALRRWGRIWGLPTLLRRVSVARNRRLRSTVARYVIEGQRIELGQKYFRLRKDRLAVFCHEAAHAAIVLKFGLTATPHGSSWMRLVEEAGFPTQAVRHIRDDRRNPQPSSAKRARRRALYEHRCPVCHFRRLAGRTVSVWRCPVCVESGLEGMLMTKRLDQGREGR
jgi:SprT-like family